MTFVRFYLLFVDSLIEKNYLNKRRKNMYNKKMNDKHNTNLRSYLQIDVKENDEQ